MADLRRDLDAAVAERSLLDHPFYKAWADGSLTLDDLGFYSKQYWRQVEAFPGYLRNLVGRVPEGETRATLAANLADEVEGDHPGLWAHFADTLGVSRAELNDSAPEPETQVCVGVFEKATSSSSIPFALGMLYGYESQTPHVAKTKVQGLKDHYGVSGSGVTYFELHGQLDVEHADELLNAIEDTVGDDADRELAVAGAAVGAQAVWTLLDGVARARNIDC